MNLERRLLQGCVLIGALVPLSAGLLGAVAGSAFAGDPMSPSADSHLRYLSGLLFAIGLGFWSTIPNIEYQTARVRLLTFLVVTGGFFRVAALSSGPWPSKYMLGGAMMEIVVTPLLCLWQARLAARVHAVA